MATTLIQKTAIAASALALGFGLVACSGNSNNANPDPNAASSGAPLNPAGEVTVLPSLPDGWPTHVPTPANTALMGAASDSGIMTATFEGNGTLKEALAAYEKQLEENGWKKDAETSAILGGVSKWDRGHEQLNVIASETGEGKYGINVSVGPKKVD